MCIWSRCPPSSLPLLYLVRRWVPSKPWGHCSRAWGSVSPPPRGNRDRGQAEGSSAYPALRGFALLLLLPIKYSWSCKARLSFGAARKEEGRESVSERAFLVRGSAHSHYGCRLRPCCGRHQSSPS